MTALITLADIRTFKAISSSLNALKLDSEINEAQEFDLRPFLGDEFYLALISDFAASPSLATYSDLFNGSTYTYGSRTYQHDGLKAVLCYYAYARYLNNSNTNATAFGTVIKQNDDSEPISEKTLARLVGQAISGAKVFENRVLDFLSRNNANYPLWRISCSNVNNNKTGGLRISAVRKDK